MGRGVSRTATVPISELQGYPGNARRGDIATIRESLRAHGQYRSIVVQESTGYVLAGNHTYLAAIEEGLTEMLVDYVDCDSDQARRIVAVDNRSNDIATYDAQALADLLSEMGGDYTGSGYDQGDLDALLTTLGPGGWGRQAKDDAPPVPDEPVTKRGDVIELGVHRLVCGDALDEADRLLLLGDDVADIVVTDPPYTVSYEENLSPIQAQYRRQDGKKVSGDSMTGIQADEFIAGAMCAIRDVLKPGGVYYSFAPPGTDELRFRLGLQAAGLPLKQVILWVKNQFVFGRQDYHWRHEGLLYGWREGAAHHWAGGFDQDTLWEYDRPKRSKDHPTMKPTEILERCITNSSRESELVVDLFGGSGSTLVAAMSTKRRCAIMEIDPGYCDVIIGRYEKLTGGTVR